MNNLLEDLKNLVSKYTKLEEDVPIEGPTCEDWLNEQRLKLTEENIQLRDENLRLKNPPLDENSFIGFLGRMADAAVLQRVFNDGDYSPVARTLSILSREPEECDWTEKKANYELLKTLLFKGTEGTKIPAIKLLRDFTGIGLTEAKESVDWFFAQANGG